MSKQYKQKKKKKGAAVQELLGVKTFSDYGIVTHRGELLYYVEWCGDNSIWYLCMQSGRFFI